MVNSRIKIIDLDGMIVRRSSFVANFELEHPSNQRKVLVITMSNGLIIHKKSYADEDGLITLINSLETEAGNTRDEDLEQVYLELSKYIESI